MACGGCFSQNISNFFYKFFSIFLNLILSYYYCFIDLKCSRNIQGFTLIQAVFFPILSYYLIAAIFLSLIISFVRQKLKFLTVSIIEHCCYFINIKYPTSFETFVGHCEFIIFSRILFIRLKLF